MAKRVFLLLILVIMGCAGSAGQRVSAQSVDKYCSKGAYGIAGCRGFFTNGNGRDSGGNIDNVFSDGIHSNNADQFISKIHSKLYTGANDDWDDNNIMGAAFIIDAFMGYTNPSSRKNGIEWARDHEAEFANRVRAYENSSDSRYGVDWSRSVDTRDVNSAHFGTIDDEAFHYDSTNKVSAIYFYFPGGSFSIERSCGNLTGDLDRPPAPPTDWDLKGTSTVDRAVVAVGDTVRFDHNIKNQGDGDMTKAMTAYVHWTSAPPGQNTTTHLRDCNDDGLNAGQNKSCDTSFVVPPGALDGTQYCQVIEFSPIRKAGGNGTSVKSCFKVSVVACSTINTNPVSPEPGGDIVVNMGMTGTAIAGSTLSYTIRNTSGTIIKSRTTVAFAAATTNPATPYTIPNSPLETYDVTWDFVNGIRPVTPSCNGKVTVTAKPYFRVYNGDISASTVIPDSSGICSSSGGNIEAYSETGLGSSSQIAALANGAINGFISAKGRDTFPLLPTGLTFANNSGGLGFGGNYGVTTCMSNQDWEKLDAGNKSVNAASPMIVTASGDIYILSNLTYSAAPFSLDTIPFRKIIAGGNIYIGKDVTRIEGVLEAKGTIYTCAIANGAILRRPTPAEAASNTNGCRQNKLEIQGSLIARSIKQLRTIGSMRTDDNAAEAFTYSPEVWIQSLRGGATLRSTRPYDAYTSLPPIL